MNKTSLTPVCYRFLPAILLSLFLLNGCAGCPSEIRYKENTWSYSSSPAGDASTVSQDSKTKTYSSSAVGEKSTVGQYENATAYYTLRQGDASGPPQSDVIRSRTVSTQSTDAPSMVIEVTDILFEFDKWVIRSRYVPELDKWADYFRNNSQVTASISGHTDSIGTKTYNQNLSEKRAQAIINYLVGKGIAANRLTAKGFGEGQPVASNKTKIGRKKNRRVEVSF